MLNYGGDPNLKSSDCETALHVAVMWNRDSAVKKLLENGADPTIRNSDGLTAFDLAENTSDHEQRCLDVLRNSYFDNSSESDVSPHEKTAHWRPSSNIDMTHNSKNERLRSSLNATNLTPMDVMDSVDGAQPQVLSPRDSLQGPFGQPPPIGFKSSVLPQSGEFGTAEMPPPIGFIGVNDPSPPGFMETGDRSVPQQIPQSNWLSPLMMPQGYRPSHTVTPEQNGPSPQVIPQPNGPSPPMMPPQCGPAPAMTPQHDGPNPQMMPQQNCPGPQMLSQQNGPSARLMPPQHGQFFPMMPHFNGPFPPIMFPPHGPPPQMMPQQPGMFPNMMPQVNTVPGFSNGPYADDTRSVNGPKDSFFDVTIAPRNDTQEDGDRTLTNCESLDSDIQDSIDGAFSWDSDIDSSTSYFSLPKHSLKGLITELKSGEERHMVHNGVNGEASLILGSDFESRISLGEIPLSLIKNTNESIISEQFKRNSGKKSAEKLFLRRAKLLDKQSKLSVPKSNFQSTSSMNHAANSPYSPMSPRPRLFRSPFPLINANEPVFEAQLDIMSHDGDASIREAVVRDAERKTNKVDKTTQKFFDPPVTPDGKTLRPDSIPFSQTRSSGVEHNSDKQNKLKRQPQLAAVASQQINPSSSSTLSGSADANTHTPSTEEYRSKPPSGNEETESEFPIMQGFGSPRNLYSDMNETPSTIPRARTLFDQAFITPNDTTSELPDGDIFKFGTQDGGGNREVLGNSRNIATVQRKIDVLGQNESDVFITDAESHDGESDGNSSGYSGDMSQFSSPDDVTAVATPKFDLKNSPSVTLRSKRRKDMLNDRGTGKLEKQLSTDSNGTVEATKPDEVKAELPASPRKRLNGITSSDDEANKDKLPDHKSCSLHPSPSKMKSPGYKTRHKVDHTFGEQASLKSPLLHDELKSYHKSQLDKPVHARRKWEHKYECKCELCMTRKGHTNNAANLPFCEHEQCHENKDTAFDDVTVEYDWKDVSLVSSTNNDNTIVIPEDVKELDAEELKQRLVKAGEKPGPINDTTKNIYMKHLARVEAGVVQKGAVSTVYRKSSIKPPPEGAFLVLDTPEGGLLEKGGLIHKV